VSSALQREWHGLGSAITSMAKLGFRLPRISEAPRKRLSSLIRKELFRGNGSGAIGRIGRKARANRVDIYDIRLGPVIAISYGHCGVSSGPRTSEILRADFSSPLNVENAFDQPTAER
jgi:hypothetical protein